MRRRASRRQTNQSCKSSKKRPNLTSPELIQATEILSSKKSTGPFSRVMRNPISSGCALLMTKSSKMWDSTDRTWNKKSTSECNKCFKTMCLFAERPSNEGSSGLWSQCRHWRKRKIARGTLLKEDSRKYCSILQRTTTADYKNRYKSLISFTKQRIG